MEETRKQKKHGGKKNKSGAGRAKGGGIAYQNKDIVSKTLAESLEGKSFSVYGLKMPEIRRLLPTNLPEVRANELRLDNLFELVDDSVALIDYESVYKKEDKIKYLNYLAGVANRYRNKKKACPRLRMIVIYTGDIERKQVSEEYDAGAVRITLEAAFLSELDSDGIYQHLKAKIERNELLDDEEMMKFIILPLAYRKNEEKNKKIYEMTELIEKIRDKDQQAFAASGMLAFTDKVINKEMADRLKEIIMLTKVGRLLEEDKRQAVSEAVEKVEKKRKRELAEAEKKTKQAEEKTKQAEEKTKQAEEKTKQAENETKQSIIKMIAKNYPLEEIASIFTSFSLKEIEEIQKETTVAE